MLMIIRKNFHVHLQANDKINQWHAYYDKMTPQRSAGKKGSARSVGSILKGGGRVFSRRNKNMKLKAAQASEAVTGNGTFVSTKDDSVTVTTTTNRISDGPTNEANFAWVD